jgi:homoserine kinase
MKASAIRSGALGCGISGSGPTIFALSTEYSIANTVAHTIQEQFSDMKLKSDVFVSKINDLGARIVD